MEGKDHALVDAIDIMLIVLVVVEPLLPQAISSTVLRD